MNVSTSTIISEQAKFLAEQNGRAWSDMGAYERQDYLEAAVTLVEQASFDLLRALRRLLKDYDPELAVIHVTPDAGCLECTHGTTPSSRQTGPCAYHASLAAVAKATKGECAQ